MKERQQGSKTSVANTRSRALLTHTAVLLTILPGRQPRALPRAPGCGHVQQYVPGAKHKQFWRCPSQSLCRFPEKDQPQGQVPNGRRGSFPLSCLQPHLTLC